MIPVLPWRPIVDLPAGWETLANSELRILRQVWIEQRTALEGTAVVREFNERLQREWAIETGIIERLYSLDRGVTQMLVERGIDAGLIPFVSTNKSPELVARLIQDQKSAVKSLFDFVKGDRRLSTSYIKELHAMLTQNQPTTVASDPAGNLHDVPLIRGDYKKLANNPTRPDGSVHEYCPPEHVASEMDRLIALHHNHDALAIPADIEAAWLHHAFTEIHPFQDGNGRVARALASLIFIKAGWFPLTLTRDDRTTYIEALERADSGDLKPLLLQFSSIQKRTFVKVLGIAGQMREAGNIENIIDSAREALSGRQGQLLNLVGRAGENAEKLNHRATSRLEAVRDRLESEIGSLRRDYRFSVDSEADSGSRRHYFRFQVTQNAKQQDYLANISDFHSWTRLVLQTDTQTEVLLSFHGLGHEFRGVIAAALCFFRWEVIDAGERQVVDLTPATSTVFQVNYRDSMEEATQRFDEWFEPGLVNALAAWRSGL